MESDWILLRLQPITTFVFLAVLFLLVPISGRPDTIYGMDRIGLFPEVRFSRLLVLNFAGDGIVTVSFPTECRLDPILMRHETYTGYKNRIDTKVRTMRMDIQICITK